MLECWEKKESMYLVDGKVTDALTMENNMDISQKIENKATM